MKKCLKNLALLMLLLGVFVAGAVCKADAAGFGHGDRSDVDMKIIASLGLSSEELTLLTTAWSTYGPAVKTDMLTVRNAKRQLQKDLQSPVGSQLVADAGALATAKAQLKTDRATLDGALTVALTPAHLQQLQAALVAQFQSRLNKKTDRLLFGYAMYLNKQ